MLVVHRGSAAREGDITVTTDQAPGIQYLTQELLKERAEAKAIVEESPVKSSESIGSVESGVLAMDGRIRALRSGVQDMPERKLDARERIVAAVPGYAACLMSLRSRESGGSVARERIN